MWPCGSAVGRSTKRETAGRKAPGRAPERSGRSLAGVTAHLGLWSAGCAFEGSGSSRHCGQVQQDLPMFLRLMGPRGEEMQGEADRSVVQAEAVWGGNP